MAIKVTKFESGKFSGNSRDRKIWEAAVIILVEALAEGGCDDGNYKIRVHRKVRWQGDHALVPFKVGHYDEHHGSVYVTIRPADSDNGEVFEYQLRGEFPEWNPRATFFNLRKVIERRETAIKDNTLVKSVRAVREKVNGNGNGQVKQPASELAAPRLTVLERVQRLQAAAARNEQRQAEIAEIQQRQQAVKARIAAAQQELEILEAQELEIMELAETDKECADAQQAIRALEQLLA